MITTGDGNCLYRSLSLVLSGDERNWGIIKLGVLSKAVIDESVLIEKVRIHIFHIFKDNKPCVVFHVVFCPLSDSSTARNMR